MTLNPWRRQEPLDHAELARLLPAPGDPALPHDRQLLLEEHLMQEIQQDTQDPAAAPASSRRSRKRLAWFVVPSALIVLGGGALAATTLMGSSPASEKNTVRCYSKPRLSAQFSDTVVGQAVPEDKSKPTPPPPEDISATASAAIKTCAGNWEAGLVQHGKTGEPKARPGEPFVLPSGTPGKGRVPLLTACVLDSGQAAVFPSGDRDFCQNIGLARLTDRR